MQDPQIRLQTLNWTVSRLRLRLDTRGAEDEHRRTRILRVANSGGGRLPAGDRRLVDRQRAGLESRRQRPVHGDQEPPACRRRDCARGPRRAVHIVSVHEQDPSLRTDALVRNNRRLLRQLD